MQYTTEEIEALLAQYSQTHEESLREKIIQQYSGLAAKAALRFVRQGVEFDDLFQVARIALMKAIDRFEPSRGLKFTTFATPTMVGEIKNYLRDHASAIHLPRTAAELSGRYRKAENTLQQRLGRKPTVDELSKELGIDPERTLEIMEVTRNSAAVSLDALTDTEDDAPTLQFGRPEGGYESIEMQETLHAAFAQLDEEERNIITLRYLQEKTQTEVGAQLGLTQMYVSRKERKALEKLRKQLKET